MAVTAPMLDADGGNLGAVLATLKHIRGDTVALEAAIDENTAAVLLELSARRALVRLLENATGWLGLLMREFRRRAGTAV